MMKIKLMAATVALSLAGLAVSLPGRAQFGIPSVPTQQSLQIDSFNVNSVDRVTPGTELVFTLQGTPNSRATYTISGAARNLPMREVQSGVYEGRYTVRSQDQFSATTSVRASLSRGDRTTSIRLQQPLISDTASTGTSNPNQSLNISQFTLQPVQQLDPGTELTFTLAGTPSAAASFSIAGVALNQPMQEISPGTYRGQYVIRRQDDFSAAANVTASLRANGQEVRARLDRTLQATASTSNQPLEILSPQNNSRVNGTIEVRGRSAPNSTINVSVRAVTSVAGLLGLNRDILNNQIQTDAQGNFSFTFSPNIRTSGTRYEVSLSSTNGGQTSQGNLVLIQR